MPLVPSTGLGPVLLPILVNVLPTLEPQSCHQHWIPTNFFYSPVCFVSLLSTGSFLTLLALVCSMCRLTKYASSKLTLVHARQTFIFLTVDFPSCTSVLSLQLETVEGCCSDREAYCASDLYLEPSGLLSEGETGMGDESYAGPATPDTDGTHTCVPHPNTGDLSMDEKIFNSRHRRFSVVVDSTIGQIKKWRVVGGKAFRHQRDFAVPVFEVCARLTARIMRVRGRYPRGAEWVGEETTDWEDKLGVFLWMDCKDSKAYVAHGLEEDTVYAAWTQRKGKLLRQRWDEIREMEEF